MKKIIHSIRNKPDHIKTRLVFVFAAIATAVIVAIWIITMQLLKASDDTIKTDSPFKVFGQLFQGAKADINDKLNSSKDNSLLPKDESVDATSTEGSAINSDELILPQPISTVEAE
jgi:hypothetical protein